MCVKECTIVLCNLRCGGTNDGSISSAVVAVVLKVPKYCFIVHSGSDYTCEESSCLQESYSPGTLCDSGYH